MEDFFTSFLCDKCHTEIEATLDLAGEETECPACGHKLIVPKRDKSSVEKIMRHTQDEDKDRTQQLKSRTIRIELPDL
jgi:DNA-directed RNA polymerase subunit RPC12/RpoP